MYYGNASASFLPCTPMHYITIVYKYCTFSMEKCWVKQLGRFTVHYTLTLSVITVTALVVYGVGRNELKSQVLLTAVCDTPCF